jgi:release factor glutamine methyltransferase
LTTAQVPSASTTAEVLLLHVLGRDRAFLYAHPEAELNLQQERAYRHLLDQRAAGTPTQYLTRRQEFWGLSLRVEPGVFIPRPETEHVVEEALALVRQRLHKPDLRLVDVGTGSGAIALALASELPQAEIVATDVSQEALAVAGSNAEALGLSERVRFVPSDLLEEFLSHHGSLAAGFDTRTFDLVVSNPPYVSRAEVESLPREVREHEPPAALFSPEEGVAVTRRLIEQAAVVLKRGGPPHVAGLTSQQGPAHRSLQGEGGWLVLELGYNMAGRVRALLGDSWTNVEVSNDLRGIPRVLAAQRS